MQVKGKLRTVAISSLSKNVAGQAETFASLQKTDNLFCLHSEQMWNDVQINESSGGIFEVID